MAESISICETMANNLAKKPLGKGKLDRLQAINLLKEIYDQVSDLCPQIVDLVESKTEDSQTPNYKVHFKGLDSMSIELITNLLRHHGVSADAKDDQLTF
jgi:hypothetical protein